MTDEPEQGQSPTEPPQDESPYTSLYRDISKVKVHLEKILEDNRQWVESKRKEGNAGGHLTEDNKAVLLTLTSARVDRLEKALERNWMAQLILAAISLSLVFNIGDLTEFLRDYFKLTVYNPKPVGLIIPAVLLYFFMRLGYLLNSFIRIRGLHDDLLKLYQNHIFDKKSLSPLRETTSFFEVLYSGEWLGNKGLLVTYFFVATLILSATQAAALFLPFQAYGGFANWSLIGILSGYVVALFLLYGTFWKAQKDHSGITWAVGAMLLFVVGWLVLFWWFSRP